MSRSLEELFSEAVQLSEQDRSALAGLLIESLDPASAPDLEAAWTQEIARRVAELDASMVKTVPWEEVRKELFERRK